MRVKSHGHVQKRRVTRKVKQTVPGGLVMPTVIQGQNGAVIRQNTQIKVAGCTKAKPKAVKKHKKRRKKGEKKK